LKQALITGASRGIGAATALALGAAGYQVWLHYLRQDAAARSVATAILAAGGPEPHLVSFDLRDRKQTEAATHTLLQDMGGPDAVVLNAGIARNQLFALMDDSRWDEVIGTNLNGLLAVGRPVVKAMVRQRRGRIVVVSSVAAQRGGAGQVAYAASKGALASAALSLALEVARLGITVNVVSPGLVETEMLAGAPVQDYLRWVPLRRVGQPSEVAPSSATSARMRLASSPVSSLA